MGWSSTVSRQNTASLKPNPPQTPNPSSTHALTQQDTPISSQSPALSNATPGFDGGLEIRQHLQHTKSHLPTPPSNNVTGRQPSTYISSAQPVHQTHAPSTPSPPNSPPPPSVRKRKHVEVPYTPSKTYDATKRRQSYETGAKARLIVTKTHILNHLKTTLPRLPSVDDFTIKDVHITPARCAPRGYAWEFANKYSFPEYMLKGQLQYKSLGNYTIEEHDALERALRDGSLRAVMSDEVVAKLEEMDDELMVTGEKEVDPVSVKTEERNTAEATAEATAVLDDSDSDLSSVPDDLDDSGAEEYKASSSPPPARKRLRRSGNVTIKEDSSSPSPPPQRRRQRRTKSQLANRTEAEKYQEGPRARSIALKTLLLKHINATLPSLTNIRTIEDIYLSPHIRAHVGYDWELTKEYKFPKPPHNRGRVKALNNYTQSEQAALERALKKGWLKAVLKKDYIAKVKEEIGASFMSDMDDSGLEGINIKKEPRRQRSRIQAAILPDVTDPDANLDVKDIGLMSCYERTEASKKLLLRHIQTTIPDLADMTLKNVSLVPAKSNRFRYTWKLSNGYSFPKRPAGYQGIKALNNFSRKDHEELKNALENGDLKAVLKRPTVVLDDAIEELPNRETAGTVIDLEEPAKPVQAATTTAASSTVTNVKTTVTVPDKVVIDLLKENANPAHQPASIVHDSDNRPKPPVMVAPTANMGFIAVPRAPLATPQPIQVPVTASPYSLSSTKALLFNHLRTVLPETLRSSVQDFEDIHLDPPQSARYDWLFANRYEFPKYNWRDANSTPKIKAWDDWTLMDHMNLVEALDKGWIRAVERKAHYPEVRSVPSPIIHHTHTLPPPPPYSAPTLPDPRIAELEAQVTQMRHELDYSKQREKVLRSLLFHSYDNKAVSTKEGTVLYREVGLGDAVMPLVVEARLEGGLDRVAFEVSSGGNRMGGGVVLERR
ncbi:hypothetical protein BJ508DRAFT_413087 [Ascobolus immersus RN42]|uniref:Uncharacterized protein n=1 Tax=Ascobolus immersus RN42 TaxID=1160509 RepID=A0A3N4IHC1_ASCIM|nr:hypothetical protein BJ508DRAFT_413087 [Ascobolus immersus RN42]